jgi:hypothetical protein
VGFFRAAVEVILSASFDREETIHSTRTSLIEAAAHSYLKNGKQTGVEMAGYSAVHANARMLA